MRPAMIVPVALAACHAAAPVAPRPAEAPTASEVIARSHRILEAFDRGDVAAIRPVLGANYLHFEARIVDRAGELEALAKRTATDPEIGSRAWSQERVSIGPNAATFIGQAREQNAGNKVHGGGYILDGWYTLGWAREEDAWKLIYLGWKPAGMQSESAQWNQIFHNAIGFNHEPNRLLMDTIAGVAPGAALDIAMGQGRNALYLAAHGWKVTGIDIADEGLRQAREAALRAKVALEPINADVGSFDLGQERWDLVTLIYAPAARKRIADVQRAVRRGGLLVYEYFAPENDDGAPTPDELAKLFTDGWVILRNDLLEDVPDWGADRARLVRFVARKK